MTFALRSARSAICPGEPVKLDISMDVATDSGEVRLVQRRQEMDDRLFDPAQLELSSPQGTFEDGTFFPDRDARRSLGTGFVFYARPPHGPAVAIRFPPYYECGGQVGAEGAPGLQGIDLGAPRVGARYPLTDPAIVGPETSGSIDGGDGGRGPSFVVYVTWVRTADYTKLLAGRATGEVDMLGLAAPGYPLQIFATGGRGGLGGRGGEGDVAAVGGVGGAGGRGGDGGHVEVVIDERFPELEQYIAVDVSGGPGGGAGNGGPGGRPQLVERFHKRNGHSMGLVFQGPSGPRGPGGTVGGPGREGSAVIRRGDVRDRFVGLGPMQVL